MTPINKNITLNDWIPLVEVPKQFNHFTYQQLKHLFRQRNDKPKLSKCYKLIGKKAYVCLPLFNQWLLEGEAGE